MHFALHLYRKGLVTAEQLVAALELQLDNLVPIGQLALEEGILSARDIFQVLHAQSDSPHERFGELAIEMGLMDRDDLMRLLLVQADRKPPVAEILVRQGVLTRGQVDAELTEFRRAAMQPRHVVTTTTVVRPLRSRATAGAAGAVMAT
jgi:hypothetical protein